MVTFRLQFSFPFIPLASRMLLSDVQSLCDGHLLHHEINAEYESWMAVEEVVAPEIDVPVLEGVVHSGSGFQVLIETPGVDGTDQWSKRTVLFQRDGITQIFVVGIIIVCTVVDNPPGV